MASGLSPFTPAYAVREDAAAGKSKSPTTLQGEHINSHAKQYPAPAQIRHKVHRARGISCCTPNREGNPDSMSKQWKKIRCRTGNPGSGKEQEVKHMLLGGTVTGEYHSPAEWETLLTASRFRAITAPFTCRTPRQEIEAYCEIIRRHGVRIAEIGVWKNLLDPDPDQAKEAMEFAKGQLALGDELGIPCCVNIAGTSGPAGWDGADPSNYSEETYGRIISDVREILDTVRPSRTDYTLEPMPWMIPDGPDVYLQLIRDVDRPHFAAHMDFVNMICSPRRYLGATAFIEECFRKLAPYIRSTHIKDSAMDLTRLTSFFSECNPGEGGLDYVQILRIIDRYMPKDAPVLLEHMHTFKEYAAAYAYVEKKAMEAGVSIT